MIVKKTRPSLHEITALTMMMIGVMTPSFLQLRPNRIEKGTVISLYAAVGDHWLLPAALLFLLVCLTLIPYIKGLDFLQGSKVYRQVATLCVATALPLMVMITAAMARSLLQTMGSTSRISLGYGFWLMLMGLVLLIQQGTMGLSNEGITRLLCITIIVGLLFMAYKMDLLSGLSLIKEYENKSSRIGAEMTRHLQLASFATLTGLVLSMFLAGQAYRKPERRGLVMSFVNMAQVIPTLTFLGLIMIPLTQLAITFPVLKNYGISGIGFVPAYIVLTMYSILPMTSNILAGYNSIDESIIEAGVGMGMTTGQVHRKIELPLILPFIYAGFSTALVQTVGNTIMAGLVGGGGIGAILFLGLAQSAPDLVILSALLIVSVAWLLKLVLASLEPYIKGNKRKVGV